MLKEHILIVDDEEDILELVTYNIVREGYQATCLTSGEKVLKTAESESIDLIVLDLMLPGISGIEVIRQLKKKSATSSIPVIMLTAKGEEHDIIFGLELGADDYVTKPFSPKVLIARIKAVIRRYSEKTSNEIYEIKFSDLTIHSGMRSVYVKGKPVQLTFTEFQILFFLAQRPGWVFTRSQIVDNIRGVDYAVTERSVDVQIAGLRKKLDICGIYIETVRGVGYRFREKP